MLFRRNKSKRSKNADASADYGDTEATIDTQEQGKLAAPEASDKTEPTPAQTPEEPPVSPAVWRAERRDYYVHTTHKLLVVVLVMGVALAGMTFITGWAVTREPVIQNFGLTPELRVIDMVPVSKPVYTEQEIRNWVADAVRTIYSYNFVHWRDQLNDTRSLFATDEAFSSFVQAMQASGVLNTVRSKRLVVSSILRKPPNILNKGMYKGRYSWRVEVPVNIRYESSSTSLTQELLVKVLVQRVAQTTNPRGLGIAQIIAPRK